MLRVLTLLFGLALASAATAAEPPEADNNIAASQWVVVLDDPRPPRRRGWAGGVGYGGRYAYEVDPALQRLANAIVEAHDIAVSDQWPVRALGVHCLVVDITGEIEAVLKALRADRRVRWVQPLNDFEGLEDDASGDPYRKLQPALDALNLEPLARAYSGRGVTIAVVDSGVEADHPDLQHAIAERADFVGRGSAAERHGTGIAGVIIAARDNDVGITGVAPDAQLFALRACWDAEGGGTRCNSLTLSRALDRVVSLAPHLVNLSLTGPSDPLLDALVARIVEAGSIVVVAESSTRDARFPTHRPGIVWVRAAADGPTDTALVAPGIDVLTAQPGHAYDFMSGASIAAAHVTAVLALLHEALPRQRDAELVARLHRNTQAVAGGASVDACRAVLGAGDGRCDSAQQIADP
ncbi:MAG: S8 family serine peptidase [Pseudomonadota bacterium]